MNSMVWSAVATVYPSLCLIFTEGLSDVAMRRMLAYMPCTLGFPVAFFFLSLLLLMATWWGLNPEWVNPEWVLVMVLVVLVVVLVVLAVVS